MAKKSFKLPMLILTGWGGDGSDTGLGSGGTSDDITACTYEEWKEMYWGDYDLDGEEGTFNDYKTWWFENELSEDLWYELNPGSGSGGDDGNALVELFPDL